MNLKQFLLNNWIELSAGHHINLFTKCLTSKGFIRCFQGLAYGKQLDVDFRTGKTRRMFALRKTNRRIRNAEKSQAPTFASRTIATLNKPYFRFYKLRFQLTINIQLTIFYYNILI